MADEAISPLMREGSSCCIVFSSEEAGYKVGRLEREGENVPSRMAGRAEGPVVLNVVKGVLLRAWA